MVSLQLMALLLVAACKGSTEGPSSLSTQGETPEPTATTERPAATPAPTATGGPISAIEKPTATPPGPTPTPTSTTSTESTPTPTPIASVGLFLRVMGFDSESVVHSNTVTIEGVTNPDAIVSINGIMASIDQEGEFRATVSLDPGTNLIEVMASDFEGNQESAILAIVSLSQA